MNPMTSFFYSLTAMAIVVSTASAQVMILSAAVKNDSVICKEVLVSGRAVVQVGFSDTLLALPGILVRYIEANGGKIETMKTDDWGEFKYVLKLAEVNKNYGFFIESEPWSRRYPMFASEKYNKNVLKLDDKCVAQKLTLAIRLRPKEIEELQRLPIVSP